MPRDRWQQKKLQSGQERVSSEQVGDGSREVETSKTFNFFFNLKKIYFFQLFLNSSEQAGDGSREVGTSKPDQRLGERIGPVAHI